VAHAVVHSPEQLVVHIHGIGDFPVTLDETNAENGYVPVCVCVFVFVCILRRGPPGPLKSGHRVGVQTIVHGDKRLVADMDWEVGTSLIPIEVDDRPLTLQFHEATALGFKLVHYGTVVRLRAHKRTQTEACATTHLFGTDAV
jgi:hypothetical protein